MHAQQAIAAVVLVADDPTDAVGDPGQPSIAQVAGLPLEAQPDAVGVVPAREQAALIEVADVTVTRPQAPRRGAVGDGPRERQLGRASLVGELAVLGGALPEPQGRARTGREQEDRAAVTAAVE